MPCMHLLVYVLICNVLIDFARCFAVLRQEGSSLVAVFDVEWSTYCRTRFRHTYRPLPVVSLIALSAADGGGVANGGSRWSGPHSASWRPLYFWKCAFFNISGPGVPYSSAVVYTNKPQNYHKLPFVMITMILILAGSLIQEAFSFGFNVEHIFGLSTKNQGGVKKTQRREAAAALAILSSTHHYLLNLPSYLPPTHSIPFVQIYLCGCRMSNKIISRICAP